MSNPSAVAHLSVGGVTIKQDADGRFCLNDLHKAAGGENPMHQPAHFLALDSTKGLVGALLNSRNSESINPVKTKTGRNGGTFVGKEIVYAYANWISAPFYLQGDPHLRRLRHWPPRYAPLLANLEQLVEAVITSPAVMTRLGAMFKAVFIKQANDAINERLPALVEAAAAPLPSSTSCPAFRRARCGTTCCTCRPCATARSTSPTSCVSSDAGSRARAAPKRDGGQSSCSTATRSKTKSSTAALKNSCASTSPGGSGRSLFSLSAPACFTRQSRGHADALSPAAPPPRHQFRPAQAQADEPSPHSCPQHRRNALTRPRRSKAWPTFNPYLFRPLWLLK